MVGLDLRCRFPSSFHPDVLRFKEKSSLQYLAIVFESIGTMAVDVTPISYTLIWDIAERCNVELDTKTVAEGQYHKLEVLNATPGQRHLVEIKSEVSDCYATVKVDTPPMTAELMRKFCVSRKNDKDVFDLEGVTATPFRISARTASSSPDRKPRCRAGQGADLSPILLPLPVFARGSGGSARRTPPAPGQPAIAFVDMEGQGDKSTEHGVRLATTFLLISKVSAGVYCGITFLHVCVIERCPR